MNLLKKMPKSEEYGIRSQMRRAAVSVPSNIAEGWVRKSSKEKFRFMEIAEGSLMELDTQAEICKETGIWKESVFDEYQVQKRKTSYLLFRYRSKLA